MIWTRDIHGTKLKDHRPPTTLDLAYPYRRLVGALSPGDLFGMEPSSGSLSRPSTASGDCRGYAVCKTADRTLWQTIRTTATAPSTGDLGFPAPFSGHCFPGRRHESLLVQVLAPGRREASEVTDEFGPDHHLAGSVIHENRYLHESD